MLCIGSEIVEAVAMFIFIPFLPPSWRESLVDEAELDG